MPLHLPVPIIYLITSGATTPDSAPASKDFQSILELVTAAVAERIPLIQLREKNLPARTIYQLTIHAAAITRGSETRLLVNDRADIAHAARADGVHLTRRSLSARAIRRTFGDDLVIGVSTHSLDEARAARDDGADFAVFGPVFETPSKEVYGPPIGLEKLAEAARSLSSFPLIALGGITRENAKHALRAGAKGIAGIRLFSDVSSLKATIEAIRQGHFEG